MNPNRFAFGPTGSMSADPAEGCPSCGSNEVHTETRLHRFMYGLEGSAVELQVDVPVHECATCGLAFLDDSAEILRHEAVCRHLGVLTPAEIRAIRKDIFNFSRSEFARLTGIGEATIGRWESGALIQNLGYDRFLRLLAYPENAYRLRGMADVEQDGVPFLPKREFERRFRALTRVEQIQAESKRFHLRREAI